jgi:hypothetical protein
MDIQYLQDNRQSDFQFVEISEKIIGCAFEVILVHSFCSKIYAQVLRMIMDKELESTTPCTA